MVEPLACVLRGAERVPRGRVLVVGNGFVGRLFGAVLERRGDDVFAVDADPGARGRAPDGPVDAAVVCARGAGAARARRRRARRHGARLRRRGRRCRRISSTARELTVVGSRSATPAAMRAAAALLPELDVPEPVVLPLDRFAEGLELFTSRRALKVVFTP